MSRLLLDTTFLIDAERGEGDLAAVIGDDDDVAIAAVSVAELEVGVLLASGRHRAARADYVEDVLASIPVVDYGVDVARTHAVLLAAVRAQGRPRGAHDLVIAATALAHDRLLVTADERAFADLPGVQVVGHR